MTIVPGERAIAVQLAVLPLAFVPGAVDLLAYALNVKSAMCKLADENVSFGTRELALAIELIACLVVPISQPLPDAAACLLLVDFLRLLQL